MAKEDKYLTAVREDKILICDKLVKYAVLENGIVVIDRTSIYNLLPITINDIIDFSKRSIVYINSKKKPVTAFYLKDIPKILSYLLRTSNNEKIVDNVNAIIEELIYNSLKSSTGEQDIAEEKPQPTFDQLLGALMKVPPPKK